MYAVVKVLRSAAFWELIAQGNYEECNKQFTKHRDAGEHVKILQQVDDSEDGDYQEKPCQLGKRN